MVWFGLVCLLDWLFLCSFHIFPNLWSDADATVNLTNDEQLSIDNQNLVDDWNSHENQMQDIHLQTTLDTIINNKSSKKIYKAVAKEWGITCKMSEQCRCLDCQGNYFDCEFDEVSGTSAFSFHSLRLCRIK